MPFCAVFLMPIRSVPVGLPWKGPRVQDCHMVPGLGDALLVVGQFQFLPSGKKQYTLLRDRVDKMALHRFYISITIRFSP